MNKRIFELDYIRGILILLVIFDHLMFDIYGLFDSTSFNSEFGKKLFEIASEYRALDLRNVIREGVIVLFVFISGISSNFAKNNFLRGLKLGLVAFFFTLATFLLEKFTDFNNVIISFNIIHVLTICILIYALFDLLYNVLFVKIIKEIYIHIILLASIVITILGGLFIYKGLLDKPLDINQFTSLFVYDINGYKYSKGDYLPLFPYLGIFFLGGIIGKYLYVSKKSFVNPTYKKLYTPLLWCSKNSLWLYFSSQIIMVTLLVLFVEVFKWL